MPVPKVQILPCNLQDGFIRGHLGLTNVIFIEGIIRVQTTRPLLSVSVSVQGKIFTSNGDARKHSPYEAQTFLTIGPDELFADGKNDFDMAAPSEQSNDGKARVRNIPFCFPVKWGAGLNKMHDSICASNPEWGFGARIAYTINATVVDGTSMKPSYICRSLSSIPYASYITNTLEWICTSSTTTSEPLHVTKYTPSAIKAILQSPQNAFNWNSETDEFSQTQDLGVGHNFEYAASLFSTIFGPGETVKLEFRIRSKPESRVKISSVRVWLEEVQGVGISIDPKSLPNVRHATQAVDLAELMSDTSLDRKYLAKELLVWKGTETFEGEFWMADQQLTFEVPRLASKIRDPHSFFTKRHHGINPSGNFASRIHIEHKLRIRIFSESFRGDALPPFDLPPAIVQVTPFSLNEAMVIAKQLPKLMAEIETTAKRDIRNNNNSNIISTTKLIKQPSDVSLDGTVFQRDSDDEESHLEEGDADVSCDDEKDVWADASEHLAC
ncbi:hypothetical protein CcCBS67573_g01700 [Chytriomyces confervae]|uniref:Uncharacterized protein n=1 Tax=Chytriomyces confervae TaxID=246404 RepID=A0A507FPR6_9FUNG|nr:hypothetical protein CcCBS67573_g01700 [Chytriomyces confervae]